LFAEAAIVEVTNVPWPLASLGKSSLATKSCPRSTRAGAMSGERRSRPRFAYATPVSTTATRTRRPPVAPDCAAMSHAPPTLTPNGPTRSHCCWVQAPGAPAAAATPVSFGAKAAGRAR
jgi:hypothetical protein